MNSITAIVTCRGTEHLQTYFHENVHQLYRDESIARALGH